ncbi:MAG: hypothetical protein P1V51_03405 [Deltaproteobacteria bacterium]|nr:hypothetical protein [Deltaproteobacteria bacterium]
MKRRLLTTLVTVLTLGGAAPVLAADAPPPVRGGSPGSVSATKPADASGKDQRADLKKKFRAPVASGKMGIRPMLGAWGELDVNNERGCCGVEGNKFVFGADLHLGEPTGLGYGVGLHLGAGQGDFVVQPNIEATYRFDLAMGLPLVPWAGGGLSLKMALTDRFEFALTFRGVFGFEYYLTDKVAVAMQLTLPDLGPLFLPTYDSTVVGTVEGTLGVHIRL